MIDDKDKTSPSSTKSDRHTGASKPADASGSNGSDPVRTHSTAFNELGLAFVHSLFSASKIVQIYKLDNNAVKRVISELMDVLDKLFEEDGRVAVRIAAEYITINDVRITVDPQCFGPFQYIMNEMKQREVESIEFSHGVGGEEISIFLKCFYELEEGEELFDRLESKIAKRGLSHISITQRMETERYLREYTETRHDIKVESNRIFFRTVALMKEIVRAIEERHAIQIKKAKRLTQQMVDIMQTDESILMGLASIKNFDEYTFTHSVNVCILSMAMGDRLRLCKGDIARLGLAALFHDIGKVYIPDSIVNGTGKLSGKEWELMKYHTFFGIKELSKVKALKEITDAMFVSIQHHVHYDMGGYPRKTNGWDLRLFSRIVTIADYYDAMTSPRVYRPAPIRPDKVVRFIFHKSGDIFDPFLTKVFIQSVGFYPVGTGVELDTGERGIVVKPNGNIEYLHRPFVKLISEESSESNGSTVDLIEKNEDGVSYRRSIIATLLGEELLEAKDASFLANSS